MNEVLEQFVSDKLTSCFSSRDKERHGVGGGHQMEEVG